MNYLKKNLDPSVNTHILFTLFSEPQTVKVVAAYILDNPISLTPQDICVSIHQGDKTLNIYEFDKFVREQCANIDEVKILTWPQDTTVHCSHSIGDKYVEQDGTYTPDIPFFLKIVPL